MNKNSKILITGARGLVGSALRETLRASGFENVLAPSRKELDWSDPVASRWYFSSHEPRFVFHCAARVGGIQANIDDPLGFCRDNLATQENVFSNAAAYGVEKLIFLGSSCVYPAGCPQPMEEKYLLTGSFTPEVEAYGLAKIIGIKQCQWYRQQRGKNFVSVLPCNLFGFRDNFDPRTSHVIPGMMARMREAREQNDFEFLVWGYKHAHREFMFASDLAKILILVMEKYDESEPLNVGSGFEISMADLVEQIRRLVGFRGKIIYGSGGPVGAPRKLMDNSRLQSLSPPALTDFDTALRLTYDFKYGVAG